jgi:putative sigma-54 modulation protein
LAKYFREDSQATVTIKGEKNQLKKVEITVNLKNSTLRSEVSDYDVRTAIDKAADKIQRQLVKYRDKLKSKSVDSIRYDLLDDPTERNVNRIVKNKSFELTAMSSEEACFQLELLEHSFYVFLNEATQKISVVYKRGDGDYGLIEATL